MNVTPSSSPDAIEPWEMLDLLTALVQKSLVVYEEDDHGQGRYRLPEPMRQYARDRLLEAGESEGVRERHRDWFLALVEQVDQGFEGEGEQAALDRLEREHDNLRAALAWSEVQGQGEAGLRLCGPMSGLWQMRGYFAEGREHLQRVLALPGAEAHPAARARALRDGGMLAQHQGDYDDAWALLEKSLAIDRELDDRDGMALSLWAMAHLARRQGDYRAARALLEESLSISRELGYKDGIGRSLQGLGEVVHLQGDNGTARALLEETLAISQELGSKNGLAWTLYHLGSVALSQEDCERALALLQESLTIFRELGQKRGLAHDLEKLAAVAVAQAQPERAAPLLGAAEELCAATGLSPSPAERAEHDRSVAAVRTALGEAAFAAAWAEGRALALDEAVAFALEARAPRVG
jgi:non-specific serine/threonine protein kinase